MKEVLLDTDILSYYLKRDKDVTPIFFEYLNHYSTFNVSSITYFEILAGLEHKEANAQILRLENFLLDCRILNLTMNSIRISAKESGRLSRSGKIIGSSDLLIAGIALENNLALATNNEKHFKLIDGLTISNWKNQKF